MKTSSLLTTAVAGLLLTGFPSAFAQNWTLTSAPITNWSSIAMSADGSKLVGVGGDYFMPSPIFYSTDGGTAWSVADAPIGPWATVAASADGAKWIAAARYALFGVYISTNTAANWTFSTITDSNNNWTCVRSSANGETLAVADYGASRPLRSLLFVSTNAGHAWALSIQSFTNSITALASSADGLNWLLAGDWWSPVVLASGDGTDSWVETDAPEVPWTCLAASADGRKCLAGARNSGIYISANGGANWTATSAPMADWKGLASSADGSQYVAVANNGLIYTSTNSGASWFPAAAPITNWSSVASSVDGCKLAATVSGGGIYTWQTTPLPKLNITPSDSSLLISWIVPSMPFVLQEAADLNATGWMDVTTQPTLNLTNLHHEASVPLSTTNRFYRLKQL